MTPEPVRVEVSRDEALVLFGFLARTAEGNTLSIEDQSERRALWNLQGLLEKILVEPFDVDYPRIIREARNRLRDPKE